MRLPGLSPNPPIPRPFHPLRNVRVSASPAFRGYLEALLLRSAPRRDRNYTFTDHPTVAVSIPAFKIALCDIGDSHPSVVTRFNQNQVANAKQDYAAWEAVRAERRLRFIIEGDDSRWQELQHAIPANIQRGGTCGPFVNHIALQGGM